MIPHRLAIVVWFVLVLLAGRAVNGKTETLPVNADADRAINHTDNTPPPDASFGYFTGRIEQDTTWRDTVYVGGDVTIAAATLTLAPNTQVHFLPYHDETQGGLDSTRAELIVEGRLAAQAGGIVFRSADAGSLRADWYGLVVERGGRADVSNATIRDGLRCVYAKRGGFVTMDHVAFANCGKPTASEDAASLSMSRRSAQPLPALRVAEKTDRQRSKRVGQVAGKSSAETEPAEITIYFRGEHKGVVSALLEAVDEGTPVTGIAELDSLASTYGLMGIYRTGSRSSGFYGYRFRLTFPPGAEVDAMAGAYWNLPYVQSIEPEPPPEARARKADDQEDSPDRAITRIPKKVGVGALTMVGLVFVFLAAGEETEGGDGIGVAGAASVALLFGYPLGVYLADPVKSSFWMACVGHVAGSLGGILLLESNDSYNELSELRKWTAFGAFMGGSVMASELSRLLPKRYRNPNPFKWLFGKFSRPSPRVSFGLVPEPQRGLSARATLRF